jgi:ribose transport system substrate-binding protein
MRVLSTLIAACVAISLLAGCGKKPTTALRIALVPKSTSHSFWMTVKAGAEAAAKESGVELIFRGPSKETDVAGQITILEDLTNQKVDAIVMAACNSKALIKPVEKAIRAGIPVVTVDSGIDSDIAASFIATDNILGAHKAAEELARLIGDKGEIGVMPIVSGAATSTMRENGFKEQIAKHANIRVVSTLFSQCDEAKGMAATEDMLTSNPSIVGIFSACGPGAVGTARVLDQRKLAGKVKLVAFDAFPAEIEALKHGTIQALIVQNPFKMGYEGVKAAIKARHGEAIPKRLDTGVAVVTMRNFNDPDIQKLLFPLGK